MSRRLSGPDLQTPKGTTPRPAHFFVRLPRKPPLFFLLCEFSPSTHDFTATFCILAVRVAPYFRKRPPISNGMRGHNDEDTFGSLRGTFRGLHIGFCRRQ